MQKPEKSLEDLEKIYLKDKYPRTPDTNFNHLDLKSKDIHQANDLIEAIKKPENQNSEQYESYEFIRNDDPNLQQNYESFSLINGAKLGNLEILESENFKEEDLVSDRYSTPLKKLKTKLVILKYFSLILSFLVVGYLGFHMMNLMKWKLLYNENDENGQKLKNYYQKNSDNMVFDNAYVTIIIYMLGISVNMYNVLVHFQTINKNINFYENDYLINHKIQEKCQRARLMAVAFAAVFCIGNIFQIAKFNYSMEFESLANAEDNKEEEDPSIVASWRVYFYILVIVAIIIKISLCFVNIVIWYWLVKIKFEFGKMYFDLKNNLNL